MNWQEFNRTFWVSPSSLEALVLQASEVRSTMNLPSLVVTCSEEGILAITPQMSLLAKAPRQEAINAVGAGDATSATLAWRLSLGDPWPEALQWAAATGVAAVLTEKTGECHFEDVARLYPSVQVREINPPNCEIYLGESTMLTPLTTPLALILTRRMASSSRVLR